VSGFLLDTHVLLWWLDDPFDRMQIVQTNLERFTFVTRDRHIQQYEVRWLLA